MLRHSSTKICIMPFRPLNSHTVSEEFRQPSSQYFPGQSRMHVCAQEFLPAKLYTHVRAQAILLAISVFWFSRMSEIKYSSLQFGHILCAQALLVRLSSFAIVVFQHTSTSLLKHFCQLNLFGLSNLELLRSTTSSKKKNAQSPHRKEHASTRRNDCSTKTLAQKYTDRNYTPTETSDRVDRECTFLTVHRMHVPTCFTRVCWRVRRIPCRPCFSAQISCCRVRSIHGGPHHMLT